MIKTAKEMAAAAEKVAKSNKTLYVMGCFGAPLTGENVERYCNNHSYNQNEARSAMIRAKANQNPPFYGFDCSGLIKGILWGWAANPSTTYGGAAYESNGVPDIGADQMIGVCNDVSSDFSRIEIGETLWVSGHIGIYIGNGLAVECTPSWNNCVQITAVHNIGAKSGYNGRSWTKHGKLPYVEYSVENVESSKDPEAAADPDVGDVVNFTGSRHYISAYTGTGKICKPGKAKVTMIKEDAPHPFHLVKVTGSSSSVYGWVNAEDIEELKQQADLEPPAEPCDLVIPTLRKGSKGASVKAMQLLLIGNRCSCGSSGADGDFGAQTEEAVNTFQKRNGFPVSGVCDKYTWLKLLGG